jgi:hypothetical protein
VLWDRLLGQGIPDMTSDATSVAVSLAMNNGYTMLAAFSEDGSATSTLQTVEPASYYHITTGSGIMGNGTYLAGEVDGKPAVMNTQAGWAYRYSFNGKVSDCFSCEGGVALAGRLIQPGVPDTFYFVLRGDGRLIGHTALRVNPCLPVRLSGFGGVVMLTCSAKFSDESQVYVLDDGATMYRAVRIEGFQGILGGDFQYTRPRPGQPYDGETPPIQPQESLIFCGAAKSSGIAVSQFDPTQYDFGPSQVDINADFAPATLPDNDDLQIIPEEVSYTLDAAAGDMDGLYVRMLGIY